jgi:hypothetical protein
MDTHFLACAATAARREQYGFPTMNAIAVGPAKSSNDTPSSTVNAI